jgi:predicted regulator of Ras-like GTPase activity (Roadblock/LC7/MglB family)
MGDLDSQINLGKSNCYVVRKINGNILAVGGRKEKLEILQQKIEECREKIKDLLKIERFDTIKQYLKNLLAIEGIKCTAHMNPQGKEIHSHFLSPVNPALLEELVVWLKNIRRELQTNADHGKLQQVVIETKSGVIFIQGTGADFLVILSDSRINAGMLRWKLSQAMSIISKQGK